jgi:hypothetical protein
LIGTRSSVSSLDKTESLLDLDQVGFHLRNIVANGTEIFKDRVSP